MRKYQARFLEGWTTVRSSGYSAAIFVPQQQFLIDRSGDVGLCFAKIKSAFEMTNIQRGM
jgi:hypothetical protein